jgi:hypothetical protein
VSEELDHHRVMGFAAAAMLGARPEEVDPSLADGPTGAERLFLVGMAENITRNWQAAGLLVRPRSVLDVTPSEAHRLWRKVAALEALRLDAALGWHDPVRLGDRLKTTDADRAAEVLRGLRSAGFDLPAEADLGPLEERP